ncbi:MAG: hypothetical protein AAF600_16495 [Bacteroidota bacterium]
MKITRKLLERHGLGLCSEEERKAIERWFETLDDPSLNLRTDSTPEFEKEYTWSKMTQDLPELENRMSLQTAKRIQLFKNTLHYAAAACFVLVIFFGGRFSVDSATASPRPENPTADHLFIFGENGAKGNLPGDIFEIDFNGAVKLYNNSFISKTILVGDTSFVLESHRRYFLSGNLRAPIFENYSNSKTGRDNSSTPLVGDFSIVRINE